MGTSWISIFIHVTIIYSLHMQLRQIGRLPHFDSIMWLIAYDDDNFVLTDGQTDFSCRENEILPAGVVDIGRLVISVDEVVDESSV